MAYVITCGDEGVQVNEGTRLGFVGAGMRLDGFSEAVKALKKLFATDISIAASQECDWIKEQLELSNWEQVTASTQQHIEALADREGLLYAGFIPFSDPKALNHGVKAHMVRPHGIHVANKVCFTLAGGEQVYSLGNYLISADYLHKVPYKIAEKLISTQFDFYKKLSKRDDLQIVFEAAGDLGEKIAAKNAAVLNKMGIIASEKK